MVLSDNAQNYAPLLEPTKGGSSVGTVLHDMLHGVTWVEVLAGGAAGLGEHLGMFPFDTIKTRMQEGNTPFVATARSMLTRERWTHLYRGCVPVVVSAVPAHGAYFGIYETTKRAFGGGNHHGHHGHDSNWAIAVSASCATAAHDAVSVPFDVVKQRMQVDAVGKYTSSVQCFRNVFKHEGLASLYRSLPTTICMNAPQVVCHWLVYEAIKTFLVARNLAPQVEKEEDETAGCFIIAGLAAGTCAAVVSTPLDNIKTQLQLGQNKTFSEAGHKIFRQRGIVGFWTGVLPRACYMAPSAAIVMTTYEFTKNALAFLEE